MAERHPVRVKVISQKGFCAAGHKVGDEWIIGAKTPEGLCSPAFHAVYPNTKVLTYGGSFPWSDDPDSGTVVCPDDRNPVVFELRQLGDRAWQ